MPIDQLLASPSAIAVIAGNPGLVFDAVAVRAISAGTLVLAPSGQVRCITSLRYQKDSKDLVFVAFDDGTYASTGPAAAPNQTVKNLNDFRDRFQEAANFGHGVSYCLDTTTGTMTMLNIFPCRCKCKD
ncbi:MAG: hypothetical protein ACRD1K_15945 [Acidimicrobiales bacterium]